MSLTPDGAVLSAAVVALLAGAPLALVRRRAGYLATFVGAGLLVVASILALASGPVVGLSWVGPFGDPEGLRLDALSAFFALAASLVWLGTSAYSLAYDLGPDPTLAVCYALTLGAIAVLIAASSWVLFLIAWEAMTLASYGMILQAVGRPDKIFSASFVFLAFGEASSLFALVAVAGLAVGTGTFLETPYAATGLLSTMIFATALIGFGLKMGVAPFHMSEWLPIAHSSAPSNASAVLSATLTLAGAYGLFRVLALLGPAPLWWGAVVLGIGAVSVLLGALFASVSEHTKGLPAYSTIENNGLILVALGVALMAGAEGLPELYAFALFAAFYQAIAHALAKTALFLTAGYVEHTTGTFDLGAVQGGFKGRDRAAFAGTVAATLSLAAAPPLAGFVSEWMILESLFQSYRFSPEWAQFVGLLAGAAVALAAGLIVVAMVKYLGFSLLWNPAARAERDGSRLLGGSIAAVAAVVLGLGVAAPWILRALAPVVSGFAGTPIAAPVGSLLSVPSGWSILSGSPFGILSPPVVPIALAIGAAVAWGYLRLGRAPTRRVAPWMSGTPAGRPGETYTSFGYSTGLRIMMGSVLRTREVRAQTPDGTTAQFATTIPYSVDLEVLDVFKLFYDELVRLGRAISDALKAGLMPGRLGQYLAYILVVTLAVVIVTAWVG